VRTGFWRNSEGSVWPDQVNLRTQHVESDYAESWGNSYQIKLGSQNNQNKDKEQNRDNVGLLVGLYFACYVLLKTSDTKSRNEDKSTRRSVVLFAYFKGFEEFTVAKE